MCKYKMFYPVLALAYLGLGCTPKQTAQTNPNTGAAIINNAASAVLAGATGNGIAELPTEYTEVRDPVEGAFTLQMPKGWRNQAYTARVYNLSRSVVTTLSPDGNTALFGGDPRLPGYFLPEAGIDPQFAETMNPLTKVSAFIPAEEYFPAYIKKKFGNLTNFHIVSVAPNPELTEVIQRAGERSGMNFHITTTLIRFDYTEKGKSMHALINGATAIYKTVWIADISGVTTSEDDPLRYNQIQLKMADSFRTDEQWKAKQQAEHEERMAQLRRDFANQQANFNASNRAHEMRMKAIHDAGDASMKRWYEQQATRDASHRRFLNYITDENTVVSPSTGKAFQVDNSHQRYFVNKNDNTYIGTQSHLDLESLRNQGVNPDDYEEVQIKQ